MGRLNFRPRNFAEEGLDFDDPNSVHEVLGTPMGILVKRSLWAHAEHQKRNVNELMKKLESEGARLSDKESHLQVYLQKVKDW